MIKNIKQHIGKNCHKVCSDLKLDIDDFLDELFDHDLYVCVGCGKIVSIKDIVKFETGMCIGCEESNG